MRMRDAGAVVPSSADDDSASPAEDESCDLAETTLVTLWQSGREAGEVAGGQPEGIEVQANPRTCERPEIAPEEITEPSASELTSSSCSP